MAQAFKCDICGQLYEWHEGVKIPQKNYGVNGFNLLHYEQYPELRGSYIAIKSYELCPMCTAKLQDFISGGCNSDERQEV